MESTVVKIVENRVLCCVKWQRWVKQFDAKKLIFTPSWLPHNLMYEGITGSVAYGCDEDSRGDMYIFGFAVPPKHMAFPYLAGHIPGFGKQPEVIHVWGPAPYL